MIVLDGKPWFAIISGLFASLASCFGKLTSNIDDSNISIEVSDSVFNILLIFHSTYTLIRMFGFFVEFPYPL